ncbi:heavy metal translocating P-type ATPase [Thiomicrorhabdus lithotrophica]|uniref:Heavy metal translocating P-type ATPase n=1 Tax=Thiomicrorhabdus lithotrophica TaxID=2949997 RepID=A0ABY8CDL6_9GAMM|nr:heavy metal translocating P-type ATPase [Thiomicrorhabdus lithotrophica]WEJ62872.1 heavy metal translocating P-type ATPase [Thiomicrorhabdus lithotrophica]
MPNTCFHCGQAIPEADLILKPIRGVAQKFCCNGCASVCEVIHEAGMESFYKRTPDGELLSPPPPPNKDIEFYDYDEVQSQFVGDLVDKREITLMSEAIHCAACVWLIEHTLAKKEGLLLARVNFTNKQIKIRWDNSKIKLSEIIKALNAIGYDATPYDPSASEEAYRKANRDLLYRLGFAGFAMMNVMWFAVALYSGAAEDAEYRNYFHWLLFVIATITLGYSGQPFLKGAWTSIRSRTVGMDVSISLGMLTTYFYSLWVTLDPTHSGDVYYDTLIDFMFLLLIGRYLEAISKNKAIDASRRLMDLQPKVARKVIDGVESVVPVRTLLKGDLIVVKPGEQVPVDGVVAQGQSMVNESMLSGESKEINKKTNDQVVAGTLNVDGHLTITVEKILQDTQLGKIVHMVEEAQGSKAPIQCTADKIMPLFVSTTISLALASFVFWLFMEDLEFAVITATAVLIITCPCAFGLATPMAIAVASGVSARNGILVKNGTVLEILHSIDHFVFDKTGTLTKGQMKVVGEAYVDPVSRESILKAVASIENLSEHSLGNGIVDSVKEEFDWGTNSWSSVDGFKIIPGKGVEGTIDNAYYQIGTASWLLSLKMSLPKELRLTAEQKAKSAQTAVWVAKDSVVLGVLFLEDEIRPEAIELIERLKAKGKEVTLLSGDLEVVAKRVAEQLGGMNVIAEVLPQDKNEVIKKLQATGQSVAMVGDGVNDAPALVRADVGIALGSGTDVSMESADIVLMNNELLAVNTAIELSARTLRTIKQNIASSITYNLIMVPLAMSGVLTPLIAAITMPLSSLVVVGNAARIRSFFNKKARVATNSAIDDV